MISDKVLAVIPARGGSKGLPGKNTKPLLGKPLIAWTIEQANRCPVINRTIVSTDDREIAQIARNYHGDVPFLRPAHLASDSSPMIESLIHALDFLENQGETYDYLALLEPTSPIREEHDLKDALEELFKKKETADSLVSLGEVHLENPYIVKVLSSDGYVKPLLDSDAYTARQQLPKTYFPYGVIYASKISELRRQKTFYQKRTIPFYIQRHQNYEIDDFFDYVCVEAILKTRESAKV